MFQIFAANSDIDVEQTKSALQNIGEAVFDWESLLVLVICMAIAVALGALVAFIIRRVTRSVAQSADDATDLGTVNRLRRVETVLIISIAIIRLFLLVIALYVWWAITHPESTKPSSIVGAGALTVLLIGGAITPLLRDFSFGAGMMVERWFGVGDLISIDFPNVRGVVERITLRSTKLRGLNGEVIWVANQTINGVRVTQKGVNRTAIEIFATNPDAAEEMVEMVNKLLPGGLALMVSPLEVVEVEQRDEEIWHITAVGETAPEREWILEKNAVDILKQLDAKRDEPLLIVDPVARYADKDTERLISRAVKNARKTKRSPKYRKVVKDERNAYKR